MTADLKPFHVTRWLDAHPDWKNSRRHAIGILKRAFNWAEGQGYITANPIRGVKKPRGGKRQRVQTADERRRILEAIPDKPFRRFVFALQETGCRPGEVAAVTAEHVDLTLGVWTFGEHKTAHQTGKPRVVYLSPAGLALNRPLIRPRRRPGDDGPPLECRELFAPDGALVEALPGREPDPSYALRQRELFPVLLAGTREMGRLPQRVFREVRRFGERHSTQFGAFRAVARSAVVDADGRVVAIRRYNPNGVQGDLPASAVVRQVRRYYQTAAEYLIGRGVWRGRCEL